MLAIALYIEEKLDKRPDFLIFLSKAAPAERNTAAARLRYVRSTLSRTVEAFFPAHGRAWGKPIYFDVPNGQGAQAVVAADFNNDGRPDFAAVDINNELLVFLNTTTSPSKP